MISLTVFKIAFVVTVAGVFAVGVVTGVKVPERRPAAEPRPAAVVTVPAPTMTETITATATATSPETVLLPVPGATTTVAVPGPSGTPQPTSTDTSSPSPTRTPKNHANGVDCFVLIEVDHGILIKIPCKEQP